MKNSVQELARKVAKVPGEYWRKINYLNSPVAKELYAISQISPIHLFDADFYMDAYLVHKVVVGRETGSIFSFIETERGLEACQNDPAVIERLQRAADNGDKQAITALGIAAARRILRK